MKIVYVKGFKDVQTDCKNADKEFICKRAIREGGVLSAKIVVIECSCNIDFFDSAYLKNEDNINFGEATSYIDKALELALHIIKENEKAHVQIEVEGKYVHEQVKHDFVKLICEVVYSIVTNGKNVYEYSDKEKISLGRRYKEVAVKKLGESSSASVSYKYPVQLSVFFLIARALKWVSMINPDDIDAEDKVVLDTLKNQCYNNLSYFHLLFGNYERAVSAATNVLSQECNNIKALYRRATANINLQNYEIARADLQSIIEKEPSNIPAKKQLAVLVNQEKSLDRKYAEAMRKFLSIKN